MGTADRPSNPNPHAPQLLTWQVVSQVGDITWSIQKTASPWTWWPDLHPDLCKLAIGTPDWDFMGRRGGAKQAGGCHSPLRKGKLKAYPFYVCPGHHRPRSIDSWCGGKEDFYCKNWGCETSGTTYWEPSSSWDLIRVRANYSHQMSRGSECNTWCHPLTIQFTGKGKTIKTWIGNGHSWGIRLYKERYDDGLTFSIRLKIEPPASRPIGPNGILADQRSPLSQKSPASRPIGLNSPKPPQVKSITLNGAVDMVTRSALRPPSTPPPAVPTEQRWHRLFNLVWGAYYALNDSNPEMTESCWLCLAVSPPYYEGIATMGVYNNTPDHTTCLWGKEGRLTLTDVSGTGSGLCLGKIPPGYQALCNKIEVSLPTTPGHFLVPGPNRWWACTTGLTPCISTSVFNSSQDFCVLVQLVPRIYYHTANSFEDEFDQRSRLWKREPVSLTLAVLLGLGVAAGVGTGTTALVTGERGLTALSNAIDKDLRTLEQSISKLEESLTSLSEVVLQNRRGLDLLFLREGGLCAALKEDCCFYADHTGVVRDSMQKLKKRLDMRQRSREAQQSWFESWFAKSPWMTTLLSSLAGPLLILCLLLVFGPCVFNRITAFIRKRVNAVHAMMLQRHYQALPRNEPLIVDTEN